MGNLLGSTLNRNPTITFNPITSKYTVNFEGKTIETTVTYRASIIDEWVDQILTIHAGKRTVVGLDVEWKPNTMWESNKSATLQLCIEDKCLIVQLLYVGSIPDSLKNFLMNPNFTFVGVEVDADIEKLRNDHGLPCRYSADIREMAEMRFPGRFTSKPGLQELALEVVGLRMTKPRDVTLSYWDERVLTEGQIEYGCIDAYASYRLGKVVVL